MTNIDTSQRDNQINRLVLRTSNPHNLVKDEQKASKEAGLETADGKESPPASKEEELKKYATMKGERITESNLKSTLDCFKADSQKLISDLKSTAEDIKKEGYFLGLLPEKTGEHLMSLIPQISEGLHKKVLEDFDHQLELRSAKLNEVFQRLEARHSSIAQSLSASHAKQLENLNVINARFQEVQNTQLKKKIMAYVTSTLFLFAIALSACWTAFKYFPSKVHINEGNNITVQGSDVTVWGKDFKVIEKVRDKEGSRPSKR